MGDCDVNEVREGDCNGFRDTLASDNHASEHAASENPEVSDRPPLQRSASNLIVKLNIGGYKYETTLQTLTGSGDNFFTSLISGRIPALKDEDGYYFIDRDGRYFPPILDYLRTGELYISPELSVARVKKEAAYYCIPITEDLWSRSRGEQEFAVVTWTPWQISSNNEGFPTNSEPEWYQIEGNVAAAMADLNGGQTPDTPTEFNRKLQMSKKRELKNTIPPTLVFGDSTNWQVWRTVSRTRVFQALANRGWRLVSACELRDEKQMFVFTR